MNRARECSKRTTRHHRSLRDYSLWAGIGTILQKIINDVLWPVAAVSQGL